MTGHGEKLSRRKEAAIVALLQSPTIGDAAFKCKLAPRTLRRWLQDEEFKASFAAAKRETVNAAITALQTNASKAVKVLAQVMLDDSAPHAARISAANSILTHAWKGIEIGDITERIAALEAKTEGRE